MDEIARVRGERIDLSRISYDDGEVYSQIQAAETMGVFQIESRAQMQSLVRTRPENLDANVAQLEKITGATLTRFSRKDMGFTMCISWEAGLEVVAPMEERTDFNS